MLRKAAAALLNRAHRATQVLSRHAVDGHLERYLIDDFVNGDYGAPYGVTRRARNRLVEQMRSVLAHVPSATRLLYHVVLARALLAVPPDKRGDVAECGAYKGASSASLSLACALVGRKLWVCDSFAGLPSGETDITRDYAHLQIQGRYAPGMYAGGLEEVRANIAAHGSLASCGFLPGLFADTLGRLPERLVLAFIDVDLTSSMKDCLRHVWPRLVEGGAVYTDDSCDMEVVRVWFDDGWWREHLGQRAPGYVGSGCGLPLSLAGASLGYMRKTSDVRATYEQASWLADS